MVFNTIDIMLLLKEFYDTNDFYSFNIEIKFKVCSFCRLGRGH